MIEEDIHFLDRGGEEDGMPSGPIKLMTTLKYW